MALVLELSIHISSNLELETRVHDGRLEDTNYNLMLFALVTQFCVSSSSKGLRKGSFPALVVTFTLFC